MSDPDLLAEVLRRPAVLWAVLTSGVKIAGAWEREGAGAVRRRPDGDTYAEVVHVPTAWDDSPWQARAFPPGIGGWDAIRSFPTLAEAESWCDARLVEAGYLLVEVQGG